MSKKRHKVTEAAMDWLDGRIAECRRALASDYPRVKRCDGVAGDDEDCSDCPIVVKEGKTCIYIDVLGEMRRNPCYKTIGAYLDYLIELKAECEVEKPKKPLTVGDLEPGETFMVVGGSGGVTMKVDDLYGLLPPDQHNASVVCGVENGVIVHYCNGCHVIRCDLLGNEIKEVER